MSARVDDLGRAYAGSQLQIQIYVNRRPKELSKRVLHALPSLASLEPRLRWVSPLDSEALVECQDRKSLQAVGLEHLWNSLISFWPRGGPVWDALAAVDIGGDPVRRGVILVEAKSYPEELRGGGCQASPPSRRMIEDALAKTKRWLSVPDHFDWTGELYQYANRLAHLYFFRVMVSIPAWLVNVYFLRDPHSPTRPEEWQVALDLAKVELGLTPICVPHAGEVFLEARERRELFGPATHPED